MYLSIDWALDNRYLEFLFVASLIDLCTLSEDNCVCENHSLPIVLLLIFTLASLNLTAWCIEIFWQMFIGAAVHMDNSSLTDVLPQHTNADARLHFTND